ncbi:MAG: (d)CMP kinase [Deltaproteobacteria bacterium]|nr:(d)CMP kinase [Deltaproteobacteria bacterium]
MRRTRKKEKGEIITIDGPAGAGKSTVGKMLAQRLKYFYLDTGAMYRAVALRALMEGIPPEDELALERLCNKLRISFQGDVPKQRVICQGEDITERIREPRVGWMASKVSMRRPVRQAMVRLQRQMGEKGGIVAEGRDTGTVVFPRAKYKFFLNAARSERVRRRHQELRAKGLFLRIAEVEKEMKKRDKQDSLRDLAPLRPAADARFIDSTSLTPEEVVEKIWQIVKKGSKV